MNDIQKARDVLVNWRSNLASPPPWRLDGETGAIDAHGYSIVALSSREEASSAGLYDSDAPLIVGTAGNPDLLDAIDELLALAQLVVSDHRAGWAAVIWQYAEPIAAAIIAADERMQQ